MLRCFFFGHAETVRHRDTATGRYFFVCQRCGTPIEAIARTDTERAEMAARWTAASAPKAKPAEKPRPKVTRFGGRRP